MAKKKKRKMHTGILSKHPRGFGFVTCEDIEKDVFIAAGSLGGAMNGDEVEVDFDTGVITDKTKETSYQGQAFPPFMQKIIDCEGLVNYINQK